eukprot:157646_1
MFMKYSLWVIITFHLCLASEDYQWLFGPSFVNKFAHHLGQSIDAELESTTIAKQTLNGSISSEFDAISVDIFTTQNVSIIFDPITHIMTMNATNSEMKANTVFVTLDVFDCTGFITPVLSNWNVSVPFDLWTDNCTVYSELIESELIIEEGQINMNQGFTNLCNEIMNSVNLLADVEEKIINAIIHQIPNIMNAYLDAILDSLNQEIWPMDVCHQNMSDYMSISGYFISKQHSIHTSERPNDEALEIVHDDNSLAQFFMIIICVSLVIGCAVGVSIFCYVNRHKFKSIKTARIRNHGGVGIELMRTSDG